MKNKPKNPIARELLTNDRYSHHVINKTKTLIIKKVIEQSAKEQLKEFLNGTEKS